MVFFPSARTGVMILQDDMMNPPGVESYELFGLKVPLWVRSYGAKSRCNCHRLSCYRNLVREMKQPTRSLSVCLHAAREFMEVAVSNENVFLVRINAD